MNETLKNKILSMKYDDILFSNFTKNELFDTVVDIGVRQQNILAYHYLLFAISNECDETKLFELHRCAGIILYNGLNFINGAYNLALYHDLQAIKIRPLDVKLKEYVLLCYTDLPETPLDIYIGLEIAENILSLDKKNLVARDYIDRTTRQHK